MYSLLIEIYVVYVLHGYSMGLFKKNVDTDKFCKVCF